MVCVPLFATLGGGASLGASPNPNRPFRASGSGIVVITGDHYEINGTSIASQLGASTFHTEGTLGGGNTITVTAANDDKLIITTSVSDGEHFAGGTGRFTDAKGTLKTDFSFPLPNEPFVIVFTQEGVISY